MKKLFMVAFAALMTVGASAQLISSNTITHKDGNGYNRLNLSYNALSVDKEVFRKDFNSMNGLSLSWTKGISVSSSSPLFIETGLGVTYAWKSKEDSESENGYTESYKVSNSYLGLTVPVNLVYKFNIPNTDINIAPFVGLYLRGNLLGQTKEEWESSGSGYSESGDDDWNWFDDLDEGGFEASRFNIGWNIGVGVEYSSLYVGLSYGSDFNNFVDIDEQDYKASSKVGTFSATVGFKF